MCVVCVCVCVHACVCIPLEAEGGGRINRQAATPPPATHTTPQASPRATHTACHGHIWDAAAMIFFRDVRAVGVVPFGFLYFLYVGGFPVFPVNCLNLVLQGLVKPCTTRFS
jgi:hypothetical protein